jgi:hypothetical protein
MDLITLVTACSLTIDPKIIHPLIWEQSRGEPWSFSAPAESLARVFPTREDALREARGVRPDGVRIAVGLAGLSTDPRSVTAAMFAPCSNITLTARQLAMLAARCNERSRSDASYCAIGAYHGSWDQPDSWFADAVRASVEKGSVPNIDMPKDSYFDAGNTAAGTAQPTPNMSRHARPATSDDRERGWSSALFPAGATKPYSTSTDTNQSSATQDSSAASAVGVTPGRRTRAAEALFVPTSTDRRQ